MAQYSKVRMLVKWLGVIASLVTLCAWAITLWGSIGYTNDQGFVSISTGTCGIHIFQGEPEDVEEYAKLYTKGWDIYFGDGCFVPGARKWAALELELPFIHESVMAEAGHGGGDDLEYQFKKDVSIRMISMPLWLVLATVSTPTAIMILRDRRKFRPGCCRRCGYDLTGNTSGVCSECGAPTPPTNAPPPPANV